MKRLRAFLNKPHPEWAVQDRDTGETWRAHRVRITIPCELVEIPGGGHLHVHAAERISAEPAGAAIADLLVIS